MGIHSDVLSIKFEILPEFEFPFIDGQQWSAREAMELVQYWWRKMPYISVLWKYLPEFCVIKNMQKRLDMIFVVTNFIWGHPLAIATNCSIVSSTNCVLARSCLVCTLFCYIMLRIVTQRHKLDLKLAYLKSTYQEPSNEVQFVHIQLLELHSD